MEKSKVPKISKDTLFLGNDLDYKARLFCMELPSGCDIVLGMDFLRKHGVLADFENMRLSVRADKRGKRHIIAVGQARVTDTSTADDDDGDAGPPMATIFLKSILKKLLSVFVKCENENCRMLGSV
eukprot:SAG31_NODE_2945_length_4874_cov_2.485864_3_plen_126_part_00